ncbi:MAG: hypothetical protein HFJ75_07645 [Eggerthellaceae bacterium]|nr:hypothetical protein [Eggerthellaceae bacterium]
MSDFYRFPAMNDLGTYGSDEQLAYIQGEITEAIFAWSTWYTAKCDPLVDVDTRSDLRTEYGMELMDVIHSCETALRMEFDEDEAGAMRYLVIDKNWKRGYYGE